MGAGCYVDVAVDGGSSACMDGGRATHGRSDGARAAARNIIVRSAGRGAAVMIGDIE